MPRPENRSDPSEQKTPLRRKQGADPTIKAAHYVCPHQFLRACHHRAKYVDDLVTASDWSHIQRGDSRMGWKKIQAYAKQLRVQPWTLVDLERESLKTTGHPFLTNAAEVDFADRLRELIEIRTIPRLDGAGEPTDVVHYAWQMQDWVLDAIPINYYQQARAFRSLCHGEDGCLIEVWSDKSYTHWDRIGAMHVLQRSYDQFFADLAMRTAHAVAAFHLLTYRDTASQERHFRRVRKEFKERYENEYLDAQEALLSVDGPLDDDVVDRLIRADFDVRASIFYRGEPLRMFKRHYGRSEAFLDAWRRNAAEDFNKHFPAMVRANGEALRRTSYLLDTNEFNENLAKDAAQQTRIVIDSTRARFRALAKDLGYFDPERKPKGNGQTVDGEDRS